MRFERWEFLKNIKIYYSVNSKLNRTLPNRTQDLFFCLFKPFQIIIKSHWWQKSRRHYVMQFD